MNQCKYPHRLAVDLVHEAIALVRDYLAGAGNRSRFAQHRVLGQLGGCIAENLINLEGESSLSAAFVTYATLAEMLNDENRTGSFTADGNAPFGANIVGTGAFFVADTPHAVPLPATSWLVALGLCVMAATRAASVAATFHPLVSQAARIRARKSPT